MARSLNPSEHGPEPVRFPSAPTPHSELPRERVEFTPYLDRVCARLHALAPAEWVADLRAELACHLECTSEAHVELGETPEQAARSACQSLGAPDQLARRWERFWREKQSEPFRATFGLAFTTFVGGALLSLALFLIAARLSLRGAIFLRDLLAMMGELGIPIAAGVLLGRRSRGRRVLGAATGVLAVAAVTALVDRLLPGNGPAPWQINMIFWVDLILWLPLGTAAAGITGLVRTRRERRRRGT